jgi:hypothetical protein
MRTRFDGDPSTTSWPDLFRPSTSLEHQEKQDVDARHKAGHDESKLKRRDVT